MIRRILAAHDGSEASDKAIEEAYVVARQFGAALTVISVIPELYMTELAEIDRARILDVLTADAKKNLQRIKAGAKGVPSIKTVLRYGRPADEILATAAKTKADLIVTGSHGRQGASKFFLGSVSSKIVDRAHCSVLVVK